MAAHRATPNIRCEIENVALSCGFFRGRWGDNGRFATGADSGWLVCRDLLPDGDTLGCTAPRGQDVQPLACPRLEEHLRTFMLLNDAFEQPRAPETWQARRENESHDSPSNKTRQTNESIILY